MLGTVASSEVLQVVGDGNTLGLGSAEEVLHHGIGVVSKRNLDGALESVDLAVVARPLVGFELLPEALATGLHVPRPTDTPSSSAARAPWWTSRAS